MNKRKFDEQFFRNGGSMDFNIEQTIADQIASTVTSELAAEDELMYEKDVDELIWGHAMEHCRGDIDHYNVITLVKEQVDSSYYRAYGV